MNILFLGDSLIEYFDWQDRFPGHAVSNLGISGEQVEGLLSRLPGIMSKHPSADVIFLMTGINNVAMEDYDFQNAYRQIVQRLRAAYPEARIHVSSLLPVLAFFISNEVVRKVNIDLKKMAEKCGAVYHDTHALFISPDGRAVKECFLEDGVHLSEKGYDIWSGALETILKKIALETEAG
jgi:lysophospholipase L1-like esterase